MTRVQEYAKGEDVTLSTDLSALSAAAASSQDVEEPQSGNGRGRA